MPAAIAGRAVEAADDMTHIDPAFLQHLETLFGQAQAAKGRGDWSQAVGRYEQALELTLAELSRAVASAAATSPLADCAGCPQRATRTWPAQAYPIRYLTLDAIPANSDFDLLGVLFDLLRQRLLDPAGMVTWREGSDRHPDFEALSRMLGHYGVAQWLPSDGLHAVQAMEAVLKSRRGGVEIILDAGCRDTYRARHGQDRYAELRGRIVHYASLAPIALHYRIDEDNHGPADREGFLALCGDIDAHHVILAPERGRRLSVAALAACAQLMRALGERGVRVDPGCAAEWRWRFPEQAEAPSNTPARAHPRGEYVNAGSQTIALTPASPDHHAALSLAPRLRFLHIPKTAGSSFQDCLMRLYPGEPFLFTRDSEIDLRRWQHIPPEIRRGARLVSGYAARLTGLDEIDVLPTLCFLREPLARVRSFCAHVSEGKSDYLRHRFPPGAFDLDALLASDVAELDNLQARMLLGLGDWEAEDLADPAAPRRAFEVLADLTAFGLVERFDDSLMLFPRQLGWPAWPVYPRLNVRSDQRPLNFEVRHLDILRRRNAVDLALYALATPVFEQRLAARVPDLARQLAEFETHQALFSRVWRAAMLEHH